MAFKMKGIKNFGEGTPLLKKQDKKSQADMAKEVVARNTSGDNDLKNLNVQQTSAVQKDKLGNSFVVEVKDNESYSGDSDNPITTGFHGSKHVDRSLPRDTFMVSNNYPKGLLIDETQQETGDAQKQSTKVPSYQKEELKDLKKEEKNKKKK